MISPTFSAKENKMIIAKQSSNSQSDFKLPPAGSFMARLYRIIDIGTQTTEWMGKRKMQRKIIAMFELHGEDNEGKPLQTLEGKPLIVSKRYTLSLDEKATLRKDLEAWRGKAFTQEELDGFNLEVLLGKCCMVSITHSSYEGKEYANISSISQIPSALKKLGEPKGVNELMIFTLNPFDQSKFEKLSEGMQGVIKKSSEYRNTFEPNSGPITSSSLEAMDDDIPF
ncbi:hypothetical protein UFOVP1022_15 [uncultured Caudovirales phage]|uniref:Uncharacterized protein n=2 Tax=uncultured Caudovirales phage TaxID=2100421 RepID=A0A6J5QT30_9CAUD|nr:hypothetical protein UFOVP1022_15 [uncultured Caudovirales phage]CAB4183985.1 hypothetical protein UFOVP1110_26 [uncultured Caudovirales phage]CAB4202614.1 hypothetical protein UFOVP1378_28 [uncultured Caudovirales phage]CAB5229816.1 hypothetical protein UFOVP1561_12 [uncultured Caudovirales phage]